MHSITLEQLIALNREISALSAAGMPLAEGLVRVADDFSGATSQLALRLAKRIDAGESLAAALDAEQETLPASYRALVHAGLQSGRLTSALEVYTSTATRMAELRRVVGLATLYPVFLLVLIWAMFLFMNNVVLPSFDWLDINDRFWIKPIRIEFFRTGSSLRWLLWGVLPLGLIASTWLWWRRSANAVGSSIGQQGWLSWIPGIRRVRQLSCQANFADLLQMFIQQQLPLTTALPLAAHGSGLKSVSTDMQTLAAHLDAGQPLTTQSLAFKKLPPLVRLAFLTSTSPEALASALQRAVDRYHQRAKSWSRGIAFYLPIGVTALVGGSAVAAYAILLLQPYVATLFEVVNW